MDSKNIESLQYRIAALNSRIYALENAADKLDELEDACRELQLLETELHWRLSSFGNE